MQRSLITLCAGAVAVACAGLAEIPVRIVTFNVRLGIDDQASDRQACGNQLTTLDLDGAGPATGLNPDVVCLQETRSLNDLQSFRDDFLPGYQVIRGTDEDFGGNANAYIFRGDYTVLDFDEFDHGGPRRHLRLVLDVPGASIPLVVWTAHFKAFTDPDSSQQREIEANNLANAVARDRVDGIDYEGDRVVDLFAEYYLVCGDLNQDDFSSTTIDALLSSGNSGTPTQLNDVRMETIAGRFIGSVFVGDTFSTRSGLDSRLDYHLASDAIFDTFDTDNNGTVNQGELNDAGFVYVSADDSGMQASGDPDASQNASDHTAVVLDIALPEPTPVGCPNDPDGTACDTDVAPDPDGDCVVDNIDLGRLLAAYLTVSGDTSYDAVVDFNADGTVDNIDLGEMLTDYLNDCN